MMKYVKHRTHLDRAPNTSTTDATRLAVNIRYLLLMECHAGWLILTWTWKKWKHNASLVSCQNLTKKCMFKKKKERTQQITSISSPQVSCIRSIPHTRPSDHLFFEHLSQVKRQLQNQSNQLNTTNNDTAALLFWNFLFSNVVLVIMSLKQLTHGIRKQKIK